MEICSRLRPSRHPRAHPAWPAPASSFLRRQESIPSPVTYKNTKNSSLISKMSTFIFIVQTSSQPQFLHREGLPMSAPHAKP